MKTTAYADQLLDDMSEIEDGWAEKVLKRQRDWIGRSKGAFVDFKVLHGTEKIRVFTTRIDTIYGVNAVVVAAEHPIVEANLSEFSDNAREVIKKIKADKLKVTDHEAEVEKEGVDTGLKAVNPFSNEEIPIWVGNYVMMEYGTGAVMSVPAHDERDFEFAHKYGLPVRQVISEPHLAHEHQQMQALALEDAFTGSGVLVHSDYWNGKTSAEAKKEMTEYAENHGFGEGATTYRLRDWGISRQRFWGAPIPIVYCEKCGIVPEKFENLPIELPQNMVLEGSGKSPLENDPEFVNTNCPQCGEPAKRETDTLDTFVDSCWYYFRYCDPHNSELPFDPKIAAYWTPVDQYIGGDDHAVMHLIYTRFWDKVMRDIGLLEGKEFITRLLTQGMVIGETFFTETPNPDDPQGKGKRNYFPPNQVSVRRDEKGRITAAVNAQGEQLKSAIERMSKSKGNALTRMKWSRFTGQMRLECLFLFAAPAENELVWKEEGVEGTKRFLQRVWRLVWKWNSKFVISNSSFDGEFTTEARKLRRKTHQTIQRIEENFESLQFNTPVAALMELSNAIYDFKIEPETASESDIYTIREAVESLILMLAPFAPHTAEELFSQLSGNEKGILANGGLFPAFNAELAKDDEIEFRCRSTGNYVPVSRLRRMLITKPLRI